MKYSDIIKNIKHVAVKRLNEQEALEKETKKKKRGAVTHVELEPTLNDIDNRR